MRPGPVVFSLWRVHSDISIVDYCSFHPLALQCWYRVQESLMGQREGFVLLSQLLQQSAETNMIQT